MTDGKTTLQRRLGIQNMKPGTKVPDFTLNDLNGDPLTLSEITESKTLILFWASWCPHCSEMISELNQNDSVLAYRQLGGRHFGVLVQEETVIER